MFLWWVCTQGQITLPRMGKKDNHFIPEIRERERLGRKRKRKREPHPFKKRNCCGRAARAICKTLSGLLVQYYAL